MAESGANKVMLEIAVEAAFGGHELSGFEKVDAATGLPDGFEAKCRRCGRSAWVGEQGLAYSLLEHVCPA
ncbi:MAG: hypothetical protein ACK2UK_18280 [Candidatus Promineifilaceae bacterium]